VCLDVPADATVLVVSKGDSQLLDLGGRRGWHFPQTPDGVFAGHHPPDSTEAVADLLALRDRGAQYVAFPPTSFWWLDHYDGLQRHLDEQHTRVRDDETCVIYRLGRRSRRSRIAAFLRAVRR
jgi:hypothetical protein